MNKLYNTQKNIANDLSKFLSKIKNSLKRIIFNKKLSAIKVLCKKVASKKPHIY